MVVFIPLLGMFFSCENTVAEIEQLNIDSIYPSQSIKDVEIQYSEKGKVALQLNAPVLHQYEGKLPYEEMPEGVHVKIFDSLMNVTSELTANYAIKLTHSDRMEAKYDVVVINEKGEKLNTEHLVWDKESGEITSDVFVKITTLDQVIMGDGLISNQDFSDYRILKPRGVINIDND